MENINILEEIKKVYPNIEANEDINLTKVIEQILSNTKNLNTNNLKISEKQIKSCIEITLNKTNEIINN